MEQQSEQRQCGSHRNGEREGFRITFGHYFKIAFPVMLITIVLSTIYIIFFQLA
jgi:hypothetical protein